MADERDARMRCSLSEAASVERSSSHPLIGRPLIRELAVGSSGQASYFAAPFGKSAEPHL